MKTQNNIKLASMPDCKDSTTNASIARAHKIDPNDHDGMVNLFFGGASIKPLTISINDPNIRYDFDCIVFGIKMAFVESDKTTNKDISISTVLFSSLSLPHMDQFVMFSIHAFKGMMDEFKVVSLELRKAYRIESGTKSATIVIKGFDSSNKAVYHGDLTNMIPLVIS